jgi:hypothetical protein
MADVCNSVTVTEFPGKPGKWNAINPASEKPKFGRGTSRPEMKGAEAVRKDGDKWLPPGPQGSGTEHGLHDRRPGAERSAPFILFSAEAKKWNSKLELECRKFFIKKEGTQLRILGAGNRLRLNLKIIHLCVIVSLSDKSRFHSPRFDKRDALSTAFSEFLFYN